MDAHVANMLWLDNLEESNIASVRWQAPRICCFEATLANDLNIEGVSLPTHRHIIADTSLGRQLDATRPLSRKTLLSGAGNPVP